MSKHNSPDQKRIRSLARAEQKAGARQRIPFLGVMVSKKDVLGQRYLRDRALPHSKTVADVFISKPKVALVFTGRRYVPESTENVWEKMRRDRVAA